MKRDIKKIVKVIATQAKVLNHHLFLLDQVDLIEIKVTYY